eukprot:CAMPEP_0172456198 /NCGR_PEP_ID=MMETSP1065-20121228/14271_1 /TAXON_ID=265537 /ORGANISM="Amphiprora paludosa, Strain CCMP125" /LENGTH=32 /DNA_ID= /DNA_START= /DNA_END= /DNA_ORIENTATION=
MALEEEEDDPAGGSSRTRLAFSNKKLRRKMAS